VKRQLSPRSRLPLFAVVCVLLAGLVVLLAFVQRPGEVRPPAHRDAAPAPQVQGIAGTPARPERAPAHAVAVGRRFLRLYVALQRRALGDVGARQLRAVASLALSNTLLSQPPQPAGGDTAPVLVRVASERVSNTAVRLHATLRRGGARFPLRCLVLRDRGRWTVTALAAAR
jgi:hypothetical protein